MKLNIKKMIMLVIVYLIYTYFFKGYIAFLPTLPIYPNNEEEAKIVKEYIKNRNQDDINFFNMTNKSVVPAFLPIVEEGEKELKDMVLDIKVQSILLVNKYVINRARPEQVDSSIKPINKSTAKTPAYPAGHALQAYMLSKVLSVKYPNKKEILEKTAKRCDICRVKAGLHYPSDGEYSKRLVNMFY